MLVKAAILASAASCAGSKLGIAAGAGAACAGAGADPGGGVAVEVPRTLASTASIALAASALRCQLALKWAGKKAHFSSALDLTPSMAMISGGSWPGALWLGGESEPAGDCVPDPRPL